MERKKRKEKKRKKIYIYRNYDVMHDAINNKI